MKRIHSGIFLSAAVLVTFILSLLGPPEKNLLRAGSEVLRWSQETQDEKNRSLLMDYLREHFDDIHDVSMRFHHKDHNLNGLIDFNLEFDRGKLIGSQVLGNETGDPDFPIALLDKIRAWEIEGLDGPFETRLPFRIKIVGSDDPTFPDKSIFTGKVVDETDNSLWQAQIEFTSADQKDVSISPCRTNREGIFVRTLIPPGKWDIRCSQDGYQPIILKNLEFQGGQHHREEFMLKEVEKN